MEQVRFLRGGNETKERETILLCPSYIMFPYPIVNPVVALNSALGFIKPLPIEERPLNQCHLLDQSIGDL
jgi:hypothetical protein